MRELTLVIPGLLWPADSLADVRRDLPLPALEALLGHAAAKILPPASLEEALAGLWGLPADSAPYAALRLAGHGGEPGNAEWMCADPAHLGFARGGLLLTDNHELDISDHEASQLVVALNGGFADLGEFSVATPGEWHLRLNQPARVLTHPLSQVLGRNIEPYLPSGADGAKWRRTINEMQMLLHTHPVNQAREAAGRPVINSLWPWGGGSLTSRLAPRYAAVFTDMALARGLARSADSAWAALPEGLPRSAADTACALLDRLHYPALMLDAVAWRAEIGRLESAWFRPLLVALERGKLADLRLRLTGDAACVDLACGNAGWWKFWRRPLPLEAFVRGLAAP